jgi:hypothetical protein
MSVYTLYNIHRDGIMSNDILTNLDLENDIKTIRQITGVAFCRASLYCRM